MLKYYQTKESGNRFEKQIYDVLKEFTNSVYTNVRVPTLFTQNGETEIDLIAAVSQAVLIVEAKNVSRVEGSLTDLDWTLTGSTSGDSYQTMNVLTQNRIHAKSFSSAWFKVKKEFPYVSTTIVVPNGCYIPEELSEDVITITQLYDTLVSVRTREQPLYAYSLDYVINNLNRR